MTLRAGPPKLAPDEVMEMPDVREAIARGFIGLKGDRVTYRVHRDREYAWHDREEWVRCALLAFLIARGYPPNRIDTEVVVPKRVPNEWADIVVFADDRCRTPYLVVECKADPQKLERREQAIWQGIGNAHSLRAPLMLYDEWGYSALFDTSDTYPALEREQNRRGDRTRVPLQYLDDPPKYRFIAGDAKSDIAPAMPAKLEAKVRRTHSIIWSGGKRDPLTSFDEWSKLLFAKVHDERTTPNGDARRFQVGGGETATTVANRVHALFAEASEDDRSIFPTGIRIALSDRKIREIVEVLQDISIVDTDADAIGQAFERFFGSVFRGELGQYFTMRHLARFTVAAVDIEPDHYVLDPTAGSGGFLLETLLQVWRQIDAIYAGARELDRKKYDFAMKHVFGIEIHETLARILKINLLLHHDGHTNIEGDRTCLDVEFLNQRLKHWREAFHRIVGNPPFGDTVREGDVDLVGSNSLDAFTVASGRTQVPSEHVILERAIDMLKQEGRLGFVIPDGLLNNQGDLSNCPRVRRLLVESGVIEAIVSLPDYAFRKSGAQNKTSVLIFRKYSGLQRARFTSAYAATKRKGHSDDDAILAGLESLNYRVFLAEANFIGYTPTGQPSEKNELYRADSTGLLAEDQEGSILGELRRFREDPGGYTPRRQPDCTALPAGDMWSSHASHRLDPKYFLFKLEERAVTPPGWVRTKIGTVMQRREEGVEPGKSPDALVTVLTISQTGDVRPRDAGKGRTPPEWRGMYFDDMPTKWYRARANDVVFSGIDLWKGCISVVPTELDGSLVSSEFPVYEITDRRLDPSFVSTLLRSRYYRRAFRAITTGHSNRRRTQSQDFEDLEICFPADRGAQMELVSGVMRARAALHGADSALHDAMLAFSDLIDQRGDEEYFEGSDIEPTDENE